MPAVTVDAAVDTWVNQAKPSATYGDDNRLQAQQGQRRGLLRLPRAAERDSTIKAATLTLTQVGDVDGTVTVTVAPLADRFTERRTNWNNQPDTLPGFNVDVTIVDPRDGQKWQFDVAEHIQDAVVTGDWHGWRISTDSADRIRFKSGEAVAGKPRMRVSWTDAPAKPFGLSPATGAVSVAFPVLSAEYVNPDEDIEATRVEVYETDGTTLVYDTGWISTPQPELDLADTGFAGLADGDSYLWRVRFRDDAGQVSPWSDLAVLKRIAKSALTLLNPSAGAPYVTEATPPIIWSFAGIQTAWRVILTPADDRTTRLHDSKWSSTSDTSYTPPKGILREGTEYEVTVLVRDDQERESTPGDRAATVTRQAFTLDRDPTVDGVDTITATPEASGPGITLTFERAVAPDSFTIVRNGVAIEADLDPADIITGPGSYEWTDLTCPGGGLAQEYQVLPVVNGKTAQTSPTATGVAQGGAWLINPRTGNAVLLHSVEQVGLVAGENAEAVQPLGSDRVRRRVFSQRGLEGPVRALLHEPRTDVSGPSLATARRRLASWKGQSDRRFRYRNGFRNIPVEIGELTWKADDSSNQVWAVDVVTFSLWQQGELDSDSDTDN